MEHPFATAPGRAILSLLVGTVVYFAVCHRVSATPLKALFRLRVVTEGGRPGSCVRNSVREVLVFFDIVFAGVVAFVCMSMTDQRQRLGDMIARTLVVRSDEPFWLLLGRACAISAACLVVWSGLMRLLWL